MGSKPVDGGMFSPSCSYEKTELFSPRPYDKSDVVMDRSWFYGAVMESCWETDGGEESSGYEVCSKKHFFPFVAVVLGLGELGGGLFELRIRFGGMIEGQ